MSGIREYVRQCVTRDKKETVRLSVTLDSTMHKKLKEESRLIGVSIDRYINILLSYSMEHIGAE